MIANFSTLGVCREYGITILTLSFELHCAAQNRKREPRRYLICLPPNARKALSRSPGMAFPLASLRHLPGSAGAEQLEQIVGETYQFPFRSHLLQSAQQEPSEPTPLFDLPKHRLHNRLAPPVQSLSRFRFQLLFHLLQQPSFCV